MGIPVTRNKRLSKDRFIEMLIAGTKVQVPQKSWAHSQLNTLIKYQNLSNKKLAEKTNLPIKIVQNFKFLYGEGYRLKSGI